MPALRTLAATIVKIGREAWAEISLPLTSPLFLRVLTRLAPTTPPSNSSKVPGAGCHTLAARSWGHSKDEPRLVLMRAKPNGQTEPEASKEQAHHTFQCGALWGSSALPGYA